MDDESVQNPSATVPGGQGSVIPLGWKPTAAKPVPVVRCIVIKSDGVRCGRWSIRGATKCMSHLKGAMNFESFTKHTEAVLESARMRILDDTDLAVDTLENLMQPGTAEGIRLKAATEILDRAGIRGGFEIDVEVERKENPAELVSARLLKLKEAGRMALDAAKSPESPEDEVIDAEIVEDAPDGQGTLF